jgi:UDP-GlcNAc:undecaprenyl-phosphate GlcNAc-1-phosphate transferase
VILSTAHAYEWLTPLRTPGTFWRLAGLLILGLGLADDRWKLSPRIKLAVQAAAALIVSLSGTRLDLFDLPAAISVALTTLWIVGLANTFNLLDHMDGLCAGVGALVGVALLWIALQTGQHLEIFLLPPFVGACLGFLVLNFAPAKIFLGDAGSQFIGFWIACHSVQFTFYRRELPAHTYLVPLLLLAVPLYDTISVVLIRLRNRKPISQGDTNHFAHRLVALGLSRRQAVLTIYGITAFTGLSAALLYHAGREGTPLVVGQVLLTFILIAALEVAGRRRAA